MRYPIVVVLVTLSMSDSSNIFSFFIHFSSCGLLQLNLMSFKVHLLRMWHPMMMSVCFSFTFVVIEIVKNFLKFSLFIGIDSFARIIYSVLVMFAMMIEVSDLRSSTRNNHMLAAGLNLVLACGGGKVTQIIKE